ncbi:MAG: hypothetical protein HOO93_04605 [Methyloglobulus sp.]|nr:hypothetical protein [Methyloglobulus sp.]
MFTRTSTPETGDNVKYTEFDASAFVLKAVILMPNATLSCAAPTPNETAEGEASA